MGAGCGLEKTQLFSGGGGIRGGGRRIFRFGDQLGAVCESASWAN